MTCKSCGLEKGPPPAKGRYRPANIWWVGENKDGNKLYIASTFGQDRRTGVKMRSGQDSFLTVLPHLAGTRRWGGSFIFAHPNPFRSGTHRISAADSYQSSRSPSGAGPYRGRFTSVGRKHWALFRRQGSLPSQLGEQAFR